MVEVDSRGHIIIMCLQSVSVRTTLISMDHRTATSIKHIWSHCFLLRSFHCYAEEIKHNFAVYIFHSFSTIMTSHYCIMTTHYGPIWGSWLVIFASWLVILVIFWVIMTSWYFPKIAMTSHYHPIINHHD